MFNCYTHGWSHVYKSCQKCNPERIVVSNATIPVVIDPSQAPPHKDERDLKINSLESKLAKARDALLLIKEGSDNKYPHPCALDHEEMNRISIKALKEIE